MLPYSYFDKLGYALETIQTQFVDTLASDIRKAHWKGGKVIICGNGGSSSVAQHWGVDLMNVRIGAYVLGQNQGLLSARSNDHGYETALDYELKMSMEEYDVVVCLTASGQSKNIRQVQIASSFHKLCLWTITSKEAPHIVEGSTITCDSNNPGVLEDCFMAIGHYIAQQIADGTS